MKKQIKTRLSRILCTALILCMMLALIPAAFAETTEEVKEFTIDMYKDVDDATKATYDNTNGRWAYGTSYPDGIASDPGGSHTYGLKISSTGKEQYATIAFKAPATGNYKVTYNYFKASNGGYGNVYVVPFTDGIDVLNVIKGEEDRYLSDVCYNSDKTNDENPVTSKDSVSLTANEKYLVIFVVSKAYVTTKEQFRMFPTSLTFTKQAEPGITINYNIKDIITAKPEVNYVSGGPNTPVAFKDVFNYETTKGFFDFVTAYKEVTNDTSRFCCFGNFIQFNDSQDRSIVFELNVPVNGEYSIKVDTRKNFTAPVNVFLSQDTTDYMNKDFLIGTYAGIAESASTVDVLTEEGTVWKEELDAGKYYIAFTGKTSGEAKGSLGNLYLYTGGGEGADPAYMGALVKADKTVMNIGDSANLEVIACMSNGNPADAAVEWKSDNEAVAKVEDGVVTAIGSGVANISAIVTYDNKPETITKVITVNDADLAKAFGDVDTSGSVSVGKTANINILTYSTDGKKQSYEETIQADYNKLTSITAPEAPAGYTFLYWAKGLTNSKQIIPGETCSIYPTVEQTNLIAVYEPISGNTGNKVEFYNYNGQLLDSEFTQDDKMPALPSMTGYGKADHWALYGSTDTYKPGDDATAFATGTHIFVAQYNDPEENITVTAEDCTVNGGSSAKVKYGDEVECVANGKGIFKWWTKTVNGKAEIVSLNSEYTFKAWETCTVTAVYGDNAPTYVGDTMRIIIDILDVGGTTDKAVMAEFVGLDRAVEKGIMLGTKRYAMSSKDNQFTIINDDDVADIKGYAILANGTLITDK